MGSLLGLGSSSCGIRVASSLRKGGDQLEKKWLEKSFRLKTWRGNLSSFESFGWNESSYFSEMFNY